jgi:putative protein kinase ArgK-like GTPase of G3E family
MMQFDWQPQVINMTADNKEATQELMRLFHKGKSTVDKLIRASERIPASTLEWLRSVSAENRLRFSFSLPSCIYAVSSS